MNGYDFALGACALLALEIVGIVVIAFLMYLYVRSQL